MKDPLVPDVGTTAPLHPPAQQEPCDSFSVALELPTNLVDCNEPLFVIPSRVTQEEPTSNCCRPSLPSMRHLWKRAFKYFGIAVRCKCRQNHHHLAQQVRVLLGVLSHVGGRREGGVEANDSLQRQFTPSCKVSKLSFESCAVSAFSLVQGYNTFSFVQRKNVVHSCLERCPCLSQTCSGWWASFSAQRCCREWVSFSAQVWTHEIHNFLFWQFSFFSCSGRVDSRLVTMSHSL